MSGPRRRLAITRRRLALAGLLVIAGLAVANALTPGGRSIHGGLVRAVGGDGDQAEELQARDNWFYRQRAYPAAHIPSGAREAALQQTRQLPAFEAARRVRTHATTSFAFTPLTWSALGPRPIATTATNWSGDYWGGSLPWAGRVSAIAPDPSNPDIAYLGGAAGGVWKTTNGGANWAPIFDSQSSLAIGSLTVDPNDSNTVYAGTGEANWNADGYFGSGIYKYDNGKNSWAPLGGSTFKDCYIAAIAVKPGDSNVVLAAVQGTGGSGYGPTDCRPRSGIWQSLDAGLHWARIDPYGNGAAYYPSDLAFDPTSPNVVYAGVWGGGLWQSTDSGTHWAGLNVTANSSAIGRVAVAVGRSDGRVYTAMSNINNSELLGIWTAPAGTNQTFVATATPSSFTCWGCVNKLGQQIPGTFCNAGAGAQCDYDLALAVDPKNSANAFAGGIFVYKTTTTGGSWTETGGNFGDPSVGANIHVDIHALVYGPGTTPSTSRLWIGSDGGAYNSDDNFAHYANRNNDLSITELSPGVSGTLGTTFTAGTQDNASIKYSGTQGWDGFGSGDGGYTAVDPTNTQKVYREYANLSLEATSDGINGTTSKDIARSSTLCSTGCEFYAPFELDPSPGHSSWIYAGSRQLWLSTKGTATTDTAWTAVPNSSFGSNITAMAQSPSSASTMYLGFYGAIRTSTNVTAQTPGWTPGTGTGIPNRYVSDFAVNPQNAADAYATVSGFASEVAGDSGGHVFHTTNSGGSWAPVSGNLPDVPVNAIAVDWRTSPATLYVGTDSGVMASSDGGATWQNASANLPAVVVVDLSLDTVANKLVAATHGRGVFSADLGAQPPTLSVSGDLGFGSVGVGQSADRTIQLSNTGAADLHISSFARASGDAGFAVQSGPATPVTVAPGGSVSYTVRFAPAALGSKSATFEVDSDDPAGPRTIPAGGTATTAPTGTLVFQRFDGQDYEIVRRNDDGTTTQLTNNSGSDEDPVYSAAANKIAFASNRSGTWQLYVMGSDGSNVVPITSDTGSVINEFPSFNPTGTQIAYDSNRDGDYEIYKANVDGSGTAQLTSNTGVVDQRPRWSPDGNHIVFTSNRNDANPTTCNPCNYDVFTIAPDGGSLKQLTANAASDRWPAYSPDSSKIVYSSNRADSNFELYTINADGSSAAPTRLTTNTVTDTFPAWSSLDAISFATDRNGNLDIYEINPDGTGATQLTNNAGNETEPDWRPAGGDTTAPDTVLDSGPSGTIGSGSASFVFHSDDATATFECRLDAAAFAACTSPQGYTNLADGAHHFEVRAVDAAQNRDPTPAARDWTVDTTPPNTTIASGPNGTVNATGASFSFTSTEPGSTFQCALDGPGFAPCTSPATYAGLADGPHTFQVRATDAAGNTDGSPASRAWSIDTIAPDTTIDSGPTGTVATRGAALTFHSDDAGATFQCRLDGAAFSPCTPPQSYAGLADGAHAFEVRAVDAAGNLDASPATRGWTVDATPPNTTIDSGPTGAVKDTTTSFSFSSADPGATFQCRLDAAAFAPCTSPQAYMGLADGAHHFEVRATDAVGNTDATPATRDWTVDTSAPDTVIDSGPSGTVHSGAAAFAFHSTEPGSTFECALDGAPFAPCGSAAAYVGLADGDHMFRVRATDAAGNTDPTPASSSWTVNTIPPPIVTSFSPGSGVAGTNVTIRGTNLGGTTDVSFGGATVQPVSVTTAAVVAKVPPEAPVGPIEVTTPGGTASSTGKFKPVPKLTSVAPAPAQAGDPLTLRGSNLLDATKLTLGSRVLTIESVDSATQLTTAPLPDAALTGSLKVVTPGGTSGSLPLGVRPRIDSMSPGFGRVSTVVTFSGRGFSGTSSVKYTGRSGRVGASFSVLAGGTQLRTTVPGSAVPGPVEITNAGGKTASDPYVVLPVVSGLSPGAGTVGTTVTVSGSGFDTSSVVGFNGAEAAAPVVVSGNKLTAVVPDGAATGKVSVTTDTGGTASSVASFKVGPKIAGFPSPVRVGDTVAVTGYNLGGVATLKVGALPVGFTQDADAAHGFHFTVPLNAVTGKLSVQGLEGSFTTAGNLGIAPTIDHVSVSTGVTGTSVTLTGNTFGGASVAFTALSGKQTVGAPATVSNGGTTLKTVVPGGAATGPILVKNPGGGTTTGIFAVLPKITGFSPGSGPTGATVTVNGSGFGPTATLAVGGSGAGGLAAAVTSPNTIKLRVPDGVDSGKLVVTTADGPSQPSGGTYTVTMSVLHLSADSGAAGEPLTVDGKGFGSNPTVTVAGHVAAPTSVTTARITLTIPDFPGASGRVTVKNGGTTVSSADDFTIDSAAPDAESPQFAAAAMRARSAVR